MPQSPAATAPPSQGKHHRLDLVARVNRGIKLRPDQIEPVDAVVRIHQEKIRTIFLDSHLSGKEKDRQAGYELGAMDDELKPLLTRDQAETLDDLLYNLFNPGPHAKIAIDFSDYMPLDSTTRSVFGRSLTAFGVGFGGDEKVGERSRFGFGFDLFDMASYSNKLFVLAPQATYEYRVPLVRRLYGFVGAAAGPSYMDYSYDLPSGEHFSGKNIGLDGSLELGLQWGPLRLGVEYRAFTQPSGLNFDGIELSAALTVLRF